MSLPRLGVEFVAAIRERRPLIAVVGDVILDGWWHGRTERMSREAPAPVVEIAERDFAPGGAANTAMNLASLGARVRIVGLVGDDPAGHTLRRLLDEAGVDTGGLLTGAPLGTTAKNRILSGDQVLVRLDDVHPGALTDEVQRALAEAAVEATAGADAEIVCDYGAGSLGPAVLEALCTRRRRAPISVVDAHDLRPWRRSAPDIVTPNADEFCRVLDTGLPEQGRAEAVAALAAQAFEATGASAVVVTLDREGTVALSRGEPARRTFAHPTPERQASGAGDTFVAALTLARACGAPLADAADFAQIAADVVVHRLGTSVCTSEEIVAQLEVPADPALGDDELRRRLAADREAGRRIVFTNGCFDVLHRGHTAYLRQAKRLGDVLVVAINGDDSVRRLKGADRPVNPAGDRAAVLAALECVDYVTIFDSDTPIPLLRELRPDVYAKGGDYTPSMLEETQVVLAYGGEVSIQDYVPEHSTTALVERIRSGVAGSAAMGPPWKEKGSPDDER